MSIPTGYISIPTWLEHEINIRLRNQASVLDSADFIVLVTTHGDCILGRTDPCLCSTQSWKVNHGDCTFSNISGQVLELTRNENRDLPFGAVGIGGDVNAILLLSRVMERSH
ncbi:hypothetical protein Bca4012_025880 [Brassica carinata]